MCLFNVTLDQCVTSLPYAPQKHVLAAYALRLVRVGTDFQSQNCLFQGQDTNDLSVVAKMTVMIMASLPDGTLTFVHRAL